MTDRRITLDERDALKRLGALLRDSTVVLMRTDAPGRGSGFVIPWKGSFRVVTARHVIMEGEWVIEGTPPVSGGPLAESDLPVAPIEERHTLLLRLKPDTTSLDATTHDIAWAMFDHDRGVLAADPIGARYTVPNYTGSLDAVPTGAELYAFVATNRDELHVGVQAMVREIAAEAFMTLLREEPDGFRFALGRKHQGDPYYRGSSGAPVADRSGTIIGVVSGGSSENDELVVAGLAPFIAAMRSREVDGGPNDERAVPRRADPTAT